MAAGAREPRTLVRHGECHAVAEVVELLQRLLEVLVWAHPIFKQVAYTLATLIDAQTSLRRVPDRVRCVDGQGSIYVAAAESLDTPSGQLLGTAASCWSSNASGACLVLYKAT